MIIDGQWLLKIYWNYFYQVSAVLFQTVLDFPEVIWWTLSPWWGLSRARSLLLTAITDNQDMIGFGHPGLHISQFTITISLKPKGGRPKWPFNSRRPLQFEVIYRRHFCLLPQKKSESVGWRFASKIPSLTLLNLMIPQKSIYQIQNILGKVSKTLLRNPSGKGLLPPGCGIFFSPQKVCEFGWYLVRFPDPHTKSVGESD